MDHFTLIYIKFHLPLHFTRVLYSPSMSLHWLPLPPLLPWITRYHLHTLSPFVSNQDIHQFIFQPTTTPRYDLSSCSTNALKALGEGLPLSMDSPSICLPLPWKEPRSLRGMTTASSVRVSVQLCWTLPFTRAELLPTAQHRTQCLACTYPHCSHQNFFFLLDISVTIVPSLENEAIPKDAY